MANLYTNIVNSLGKKQISRAIFYLRRWNQQLADSHFSDRTDNISNIALAYSKQLYSYLTATSDDIDLAVSLIYECYELADIMKRDQMKLIGETYENNQAQKRETDDAVSPKEMFAQVAAYNRQTAEGLSPSRTKYEDSLDTLFNYYRLTTNFTDDDIEAYKRVVINEQDIDHQTGTLVQPLAVSALTLNVINNFSEDNILLLADTIASPNIQVRARALTGFVLITALYYQRYDIFLTFRHIIDSVIESEKEAIKETVTALMRSLETEHINTIMNNEIVPEILKRNPEQMIKDNNPIIDLETLAGNPDWADYKNSLEYKIIQLSELQAEGSDIGYNSFHQHKHQPFFRKMSHWFLPFDTHWSDIEKMFSKSSLPIEKMLQSHYMCASDCYSFCLAFSIFSSSNKTDINNLIAKNIPTDDDEDHDIDLGNKDAFKTEINEYVHNLYRFFKLNAWNYDDLIADVALYPSTIIPILFGNDTDTQYELANFYFNKQQYKPALELYRQLEYTAPSAELFQKTGFAFEKEGDMQQALQYYTIANTYAPDELWTMKRMLACTEDKEKRKSIYDKILLIDENNKSALLGIAKSLTDDKQYDKAMEIYYKLDFLYPDSLSIQRQAALCSMHRQDFATALRYWHKIDEQSDNAHDLMNTAHTYFITGDRQSALDYYAKSWNKFEKKNEFWQTLRDDSVLLTYLGATDRDIHLLNELLINKLYN